MTGAEGLYSTLVTNCIFNVFLFYTAIALNIITIQALRKTSSLPRTLKTLLLSLAASDLGVGLLAHPAFVAHLIIQIRQNTSDNAYDKHTSKRTPVSPLKQLRACYMKMGDPR